MQNEEDLMQNKNKTFSLFKILELWILLHNCYYYSLLRQKTAYKSEKEI